MFSVCHTWLWVWEERWKIHSNWTLWVWQCKLDFVNWISRFSLFFFNFYLVKEKFSKHLFLIQRAVRIMRLNFFLHDGGKSVPAYFMCSQKILLHQCYAFQLQILPYTCQNILTTQLNKHTLQVLKNEVNLWCACVNVPKQHVWSRLPENCSPVVQSMSVEPHRLKNNSSQFVTFGISEPERYMMSSV